MVVVDDWSASVLARLKNESKRLGIQLQQLLNLFYQDEWHQYVESIIENIDVLA